MRKSLLRLVLATLLLLGCTSSLAFASGSPLPAPGPSPQAGDGSHGC